jgi:hypothetical protein
MQRNKTKKKIINNALTKTRRMPLNPKPIDKRMEIKFEAYLGWYLYYCKRLLNNKSTSSECHLQPTNVKELVSTNQQTKLLTET